MRNERHTAKVTYVRCSVETATTNNSITTMVSMTATTVALCNFPFKCLTFIHLSIQFKKRFA